MNTALIQTNRLLCTSNYYNYLKRIESYERDRQLCRHNLAHFLDVARIATIIALDEGLTLSRDLIYTTALLHDIGRFMQYESNIPHEVASHRLAKDLLKDLCFTENEKQLILSAIANHRRSDCSGFDAVFYKADKSSRACYCCLAQDDCNWDDTKKNLEITY